MSEPQDVEALRQAVIAGRRFKYLLFWGHTRDPRGVGPTCLSQWYAAPFEIDGVRYATAEHFMMAEKARLFGDDEHLTQILASRHPGKAKTLGRSVRGFNDDTWNAARMDIVVRANVAKFSQNDDLSTFLLRTGKKVLVEASPHDRIWGIGLSAQNEFAERPQKWRGLNLLGFALMQVRAELREEA